MGFRVVSPSLFPPPSSFLFILTTAAKPEHHRYDPNPPQADRSDPRLSHFTLSLLLLFSFGLPPLASSLNAPCHLLPTPPTPAQPFFSSSWLPPHSFHSSLLSSSNPSALRPVLVSCVGASPLSLPLFIVRVPRLLFFQSLIFYPFWKKTLARWEILFPCICWKH